MNERLTCRECADFLDDYLDGSLDPSEAQVFEEHLQRCPPCVEFLRSYRETIHLGREACRCKASPGSDRIPEGLVEAILHARKG